MHFKNVPCSAFDCTAHFSHVCGPLAEQTNFDFFFHIHLSLRMKIVWKNNIILLRLYVSLEQIHQLVNIIFCLSWTYQKRIAYDVWIQIQ